MRRLPQLVRRRAVPRSSAPCWFSPCRAVTSAPHTGLPTCTHVSHLAPVSPSSPPSSHATVRVSRQRAPGEAMRLLLVHIALLGALTWSTGLSGCGPPTPGASSNTQSSSAAVGGPSNAPIPATAGSSPTQIAATRPSESPSRPSLQPEPRPDTSEEPAPLPEQLVLPEWIATALKSPDVRVRLRALDR